MDFFGFARSNSIDASANAKMLFNDISLPRSISKRSDILKMDDTVPGVAMQGVESSDEESVSESYCPSENAQAPALSSEIVPSTPPPKQAPARVPAAALHFAQGRADSSDAAANARGSDCFRRDGHER